MAWLYGMFCSWVVVLRKFAAWKHDRLKTNYESEENLFQVLEQDCKNEEVATGRPANLVNQLKLMKQFEARESAKSRWITAERKLNKRKRLEAKVNGLQGRKIPYTFGLVDMALVLKLVDFGQDYGLMNFTAISDAITSWIS